MRKIVLLSAVLLAACQPQAPDGAPAEAPADAPAAVATPEPASPPPAPAAQPTPADDFKVDLKLVGTEPFWAVQVRQGELVLQRPDMPDMRTANPGPVATATTAVWTAEGMTIVVRRETCSDGMSDRVYPFAAEVTVGTEVLKGCAARADEVYAPA